VLLHPAVGAALLVPLTQATQDGVARLSCAIGRARLEAVFAGRLPVMQVAVGRQDLHRVEHLLAEAFATEPRMTLRGGAAWTGPARLALGGEVTRPARPEGMAVGVCDGEVPDAWPEEPGSGTGLLGWFWTAVVALVSVTFAVLHALGPPQADGAASERASASASACHLPGCAAAGAVSPGPAPATAAPPGR
jgi:hypothetical protein